MDQSTRLDAVHDLMEEILEIQRENSKDTEVLEKIHEIIQKSSQIVEKSESTAEMIIDAKILLTGSQVVNSSVSSLDTNLTSFNEEEYKNGILNYIRNNCNNLKNERLWECLAPAVYHLFRKSNPVTFMLGTSSLGVAMPKKDKVRHEKTIKHVEAETRLCSATETESVEQTEENIYKNILKSLVKFYTKNGKKPVSYFEFIIDPKSYWSSVENIFYFSFLVRDGSVKLFFDDDELPVIEPVLNKDANAMQCSENDKQFCLGFSKKDWLDCIETFQISSAKIQKDSVENIKKF